MKFLITKANNEVLTLLSKLIDDGKIKSVIDKQYSLDETAEAHRYYEKGHTVRKVVIEVFHKQELFMTEFVDPPILT